MEIKYIKTELTHASYKHLSYKERFQLCFNIFFGREILIHQIKTPINTKKEENFLKIGKNGQ